MMTKRRPARLTREEHHVVAERLGIIKARLAALGNYLGGKVKANDIDAVLAVERRLDSLRSRFDDRWCELTDEHSPYYGSPHFYDEVASDQ